jgi:hypothetical protein
VPAVLDVYDASGHLLGYYSGLANNDDQFEAPDSMIVDLKLPYTGAYYVVVDTFHFLPGDPHDPGSGPAHTDTETGNYELFMYQYDAAFTNEQGHTLSAGSGNEVLKGGAGNDTFVVGPGHDTVFGGGGTNTVQDSGASRYTLTNARLTGSGIADLSNIQNAVLTGSAAGTTFDLSGWTGTATVIGVAGTNTLVVSRDVNFTLTNSSLTLSDGTVITLHNIQNVVLTGGSSNNTFDGSGWTGTATLDGLGGLNTVVVSRPGNFVLTDGNLTVSSGGTFQLTHVTNAVLTGATGSIFDVRGFSGTDILNVAGGANPVASPRGANFNASEGIAAMSAMGSFTDLGATVATNYTVSANWGDASTSAGGTTVSGSTVTIQGSHPYPEESSYTVTTTFSQGTAFSVIVSSRATVTDSQLTSAAVLTINPVEGISFSGTVATFIDPGGSEPVSGYTATVDWGDNSGADPVGTITDNGNGHFTVTGTHLYRDEGTYTIRVTLTHDLLPAVAASSGTAVVADAPLTASSSALTTQQGIALSNRQVATFTDTNPRGPIGDFTATISWGDGATSAGTITQPGGVGSTLAVSGTHTYGVSTTETVTVTIHDVGGQSIATSFAVTVQPSIIVLSPTAGGALTLTGTVGISIAGAVVVDSNSANALTASGNAQLTAGSIQVVGGVSASGGVVLSPIPVTGAQPVPDPLAGLTAPAGGTNLGTVNLSRGSLIINPGVYSQISVSGNTTVLTMNPGVYVITGGGFSVSNSASVSGTGVVIYNAGSNFPAAGGTFGALSLGSSGLVSLTAPTNGPYAGILLFQASDNTRSLSLNASAVIGLSGTIYAPAALLSLGGSSQLETPAIVNLLTLNGNGGSAVMAAGFASGLDTAPDLGSSGGDLFVYVNDPSGSFTPDERAGLQDSMQRLNALLAPSGVTIAEVGNRVAANVVADAGVTSFCGGPADGALGCYVPSTPVREITILRGWNWYTGANPNLIGPDEYDFETVFIHELGHALGLDHNPDAASAMHGTLDAGTAHRSLTAHDLNSLDPNASADNSRAEAAGAPVADRHFVGIVRLSRAATTSGSANADTAVPRQNRLAVTVPFADRPATSLIPGRSPLYLSFPGLAETADSAVRLLLADAVFPWPIDVGTAAEADRKWAVDTVMQHRTRTEPPAPTSSDPGLGTQAGVGSAMTQEEMDADVPAGNDGVSTRDVDQLEIRLVGSSLLTTTPGSPEEDGPRP